MTAPRQPFNIMIVAQAGRPSVRGAADGRLSAGERARVFRAADRGRTPAGAALAGRSRLPAPFRDALADLGADIRPFHSRAFGASYPHGNKIEGLAALPPGEPFLFLDTDTLILSDISAVPFDFDRPTASMRREGTWPVEDLYWPGYTAIWKSLYDRFGLDFGSSLDLTQPTKYWQRYLYFNAGWFLGPTPRPLARASRLGAVGAQRPAAELALQPLDPWLDQVVLPLVIHSFGGGRPGPELAGLDGEVTCHYRTLPLLYARESDRAVAVLESVAAPNKVKKLLKEYAPSGR